MANANNPSGFKPLRHMGGGVIRSQAFNINTSGTTGFNDSIATGDLVKLNADGTIEAGANGDGVALGVFDGCDYTASDGSKVFARRWPASTAVLSGSVITAHVYCDPMITYEVMTNTCAATDVGAVSDVVVGTSSTVTGQSASYVDVADVTNGVARILKIIDRPDNAVGAYCRVEVLLNSQLNVTTSI